jgi:hypothetical protein
MEDGISITERLARKTSTRGHRALPLRRRIYFSSGKEARAYCIAWPQNASGTDKMQAAANEKHPVRMVL